MRLGPSASTSRPPPRVPVTVVWGRETDVQHVLTPPMTSSGSNVQRDRSTQVIGLTSNAAAPGPRTTRPPLTGERTSGCRCCMSRLDLVSTIRTLLERPHAPAHLVLALTPDDDLLVALRTLLAEPDLEPLIDLDAVLVAIDAPTLATRRSAKVPLADATLREALAVADRVVLTRKDAVVRLARIGVERSLRPFIPLGQLMTVTSSRPSIPLLTAWHGTPPRPTSGHVLDTSPAEQPSQPQALRFSLDAPVDPAQFDRWLDETIRTYGRRLYRTQGTVHVRGRSAPICFRGVFSFAASHPATGRPPHRRGARTTFVLVGEDLNEEALTSGFRATAAS